MELKSKSWTIVALLLLHIGIGAGARAVEPAKLSIDDIIQGIENNEKVWHEQTSWMVKYTHIRERIAPPPGKAVQFPDVELMNARRGKAMVSYHRQPLVHGSGSTETWQLWDGTNYTERTGTNAYKQSFVSGNLASYFWYPMGLMRDRISDTIPIPEAAFTQDKELSLLLPHCLKAHKKEYTVRPELEEIDGVWCHVLERPGKDILWIAADKGFNVCRRTIYQESGALWSEFKANDFKEYAQGIWLPKRQMSVAFNNDSDPNEYRGRVRFVMLNNLQEAHFGDVPDTVFTVPLPDGVKVEIRPQPQK